jgi:peptidoglycan/xylan/chitin deacetylase (PgdA/CDA1 family)
VTRRLRSAAAPATKRLLFRAGAYSALRRLRPNHGVAVLRYHAICGPEGYWYADPHLCVSPEAFERHVRYLAENYVVLPLPDVTRALRERRPLPGNTVAITFDDGYADNLAAARVLHRYDANGTFYITAGCLAGGDPFWPSELRFLLAHVPGDRLEVDIDGEQVTFPLGSEPERKRALVRLTSLFKSYPIPVRERMRDSIRAQATRTDMPRVMLTWDELGEMRQLGMTIGAHTMTHPNLPSAGIEAAAAEIGGSKRRLQHALGAPVTMFSYPNGGAERYFTPELEQVVRTCGFLAAATSQNGFASYTSNPYALERIQVSERLEDLAFTLEVERFAFKPQRKAHAPA